MARKPKLRIPKHLSNSMTYAELETWIEAEFERLRRKAIREERARSSQKQTKETKNDGMEQ